MPSNGWVATRCQQMMRFVDFASTPTAHYSLRRLTLSEPEAIEVFQQLAPGPGEQQMQCPEATRRRIERRASTSLGVRNELAS